MSCWRLSLPYLRGILREDKKSNSRSDRSKFVILMRKSAAALTLHLFLSLMLKSWAVTSLRLICRDGQKSSMPYYWTQRVIRNCFTPFAMASHLSLGKTLLILQRMSQTARPLCYRMAPIILWLTMMALTLNPYKSFHRPWLMWRFAKMIKELTILEMFWTRASTLKLFFLPLLRFLKWTTASNLTKFVKIVLKVLPSGNETIIPDSANLPYPSQTPTQIRPKTFG